ncbi:MAG: hypothetical protein PHW66_03760 [Gallionella sp.]|nr:hypothetical protein [Gallionella sp.]
MEYYGNSYPGCWQELHLSSAHERTFTLPRFEDYVPWFTESSFPSGSEFQPVDGAFTNGWQLLDKDWCESRADGIGEDLLHIHMPRVLNGNVYLV